MQQDLLRKRRMSWWGQSNIVTTCNVLQDDNQIWILLLQITRMPFIWIFHSRIVVDNDILHPIIAFFAVFVKLFPQCSTGRYTNTNQLSVYKAFLDTFQPIHTSLTWLILPSDSICLDTISLTSLFGKYILLIAHIDEISQLVMIL